MKFYKGQKVVCISERRDWDNVIPDFDETLKIALGVRKVPEKDKSYTVNHPFWLHHGGKNYITIEGFEHNSFDEKAFKPINEEKLEQESKISKSIKLQ